MTFGEYLGNARIVAALRRMLTSEHLPQAMLFTGLRGVGKFKIGRAHV